MNRLLPLCVLAAALLACVARPGTPGRAGDSKLAPPAGAVERVPAEGEAAKYWPRWRGPTGQAVVPDGPYPDQWSATENVLWKVPLPGRGNSSPILFKDRIFLTTASEGGKKRSLLCLRREDGKKLWETASPNGIPEKVKDKNGWASATPSTDGERVYAFFGNNGLLCVDLDGKQVWHVKLGPFDAYHGTACSPLLYKDRLILFQDHRVRSGSFVAAYDKLTGKELWKKPRKERVGWGSPVAIRVHGRDQIIVSSQFTVYAYAPDDGRVLWTCGGNLEEVIPVPVVGHGLLFCCSGRSGPTLAIRPEGARGEVTKTHLVWKTVKGSPFVPSPLLYGDELYVINDIISVATCFEAKSGKLLWQGRLGEPVKEGFSASPVGVNGKVFITNDQGDTFVLKAGKEFRLLHVNHLGERTLASPALLDGRWYIRTAGHLVCIGKKEQ
jgi:outer membrane protein assembly factor BamB